MILVSPAKITDKSLPKIVRCPLCKTGRLCDIITYDDNIKSGRTIDFYDSSILILKCPHCKNLIGIAYLK